MNSMRNVVFAISNLLLFCQTLKILIYKRKIQSIVTLTNTFPSITTISPSIQFYYEPRPVCKFEIQHPLDAFKNLSHAK